MHAQHLLLLILSTQMKVRKLNILSLMLQLFDAVFSIECDFDKNPHQMLKGWSNMEISYLTSELEGFSSCKTSKLHRLKFCEVQLFCAQKKDRIK